MRVLKREQKQEISVGNKRPIRLGVSLKRLRDYREGRKDRLRELHPLFFYFDSYLYY